MAVTYSSTSPYFLTNTDPYLDILEYRAIPPMADDIIYKIQPQYQHKPHLLAYDLYSSIGLWWVFMVRNRNIIQDPIWDFVSGKEIYIPKLSTLKDALNIG